MIRFVSYNNTIVNKYCIRKDQTLLIDNLSVSFLIIKKVIVGDKKKKPILQAFKKSRFLYAGVCIMSDVLLIINPGQRCIWYLRKGYRGVNSRPCETSFKINCCRLVESSALLFNDIYRIL